jgi:formylglycine-generating enzyme required for sulfatase activity
MCFLPTTPYRLWLRDFVLAVLVVCGGSSFAGNIQVTSVALTGQNVAAGTNNIANFSLVQFNLSWENSWRSATGPANWDAAWVFVKFQVGGSDANFTGVSSSGTTITVSSTANLRPGMPVRVTSGTGAFASNTVISSISNSTQFIVSAAPTTTLYNANIECMRIWEHAYLHNTGHTAPYGSTIDAGLLTPSVSFNATTNPALGVFVYRSSNGYGNNNFNAAQLRWNYVANGLSDNAVVRIQVFAVEMVYVPGGVDFNVGGGGGTSAFASTTINTANATTTPSGTGSLGGQAGGFPTGQTAPANSSWPNGYSAFYCMKYEISQGQYREFLNTLTRIQQANRVTMDGTVGRYAGGYTWSGSSWSASEVSNLTTPVNRVGLRLVADPGGVSPRTYACDLNTSGTLPTGVNQSDDGEWIAMSQLNWMDGCAYMQWSGLRPMTELEYEKACRGNQAAVSGEYAWGNATVTGATGISSGGTNTETFSNAGANASVSNVGGVQGPLRVGAFAGAATTRAQAGATYYGIMEMSGNLWEGAVTIIDATGRAFTGLHGNGTLSTAGHATTTAWPGLSSGEVTMATGSGLRGGVWGFNTASLRVSDRYSAASAWTARYSMHGFRGVRLAP